MILTSYDDCLSNYIFSFFLEQHMVCDVCVVRLPSFQSNSVLYITIISNASLQELGIQRTEGTWWRHQMETFSVLLAVCAGNSPVTGEFPTQRPVTRSFDVFFGLHPNKRLSKQSWGWWYETPSCPLWRHCNDNGKSRFKSYYQYQLRQLCWQPVIQK